MNTLQKFIYYTKYAKNNETWDQCVDRYIDYVNFDPKYKDDIRKAILNMDVMPSMRLLRMSGVAVDRDNCSVYNCSYREINEVSAFGEFMYLLFRGVGVGTSVEWRVFKKLPNLPQILTTTNKVLILEDTAESICDNVNLLIECLFNGKIPSWDMSKIRPKGTPLKITGGTAIGSEVIEEVFVYIISVFINAVNNKQIKLYSIDVYDLITKISSIIQFGGSRRCALLVLIDAGDNLFNNFKCPEKPHRYFANVSEVYFNELDKYDIGRILQNANNPSGEPGFFLRYNARKRHPNCTGLNPCGEILMEDKSFCNLSEIVCKPDDTPEKLLWKAKIASIIGTYQSKYKYFPYLSSGWKTPKDISLGVSLTGIWDCPAVRSSRTSLPRLYRTIKTTSLDVSEELGIQYASRFTCIKPSGTVSQLANCSSGIHPAYAKYYKRAVRVSKNDPNALKLISNGISYEPEVNGDGYVLYFPVYRENFKEVDFDQFIETYNNFFTYYTDNNISCTITYNKNRDRDKVATWLENTKIISATFLPEDTSFYPQMPYQKITEKEYKELPEVDFTSNNNKLQEFACTAGHCEIL